MKKGRVTGRIISVAARDKLGHQMGDRRDIMYHIVVDFREDK